MPLPQRLARELRALLRNRVAIVLLAMAFAWFLAERRRRRRAARHRKRRNRRWQEAIRGAQALAELRGFGVRNAGAFVKLSRGRTHYVLAGPEDGAPVVLCHGFAVGCWVYDRFVAPLAAQGFRVLLFDWYGCGYSDRAAPDPAFKGGTREAHSATARGRTGRSSGAPRPAARCTLFCAGSLSCAPPRLAPAPARSSRRSPTTPAP